MKKTSHLIALIVGLIGLLSYFSSCEKDYKVGKKLLKDDLRNVKQIDTFNLTSYSIDITKTREYTGNKDYFPIGYCKDPVFGKIETSALFQVSIPIPSAGASVTLKKKVGEIISVRLCLGNYTDAKTEIEGNDTTTKYTHIEEHFGNIKNDITVKVYKLANQKYLPRTNDTLNNSLYYSDYEKLSEYEAATELLTTVDEYKVSGERNYITLNNSFAEGLFAQEDKYFEDNVKFQDSSYFFNGFYIKAEVNSSKEGAIFYHRLNHTTFRGYKDTVELGTYLEVRYKEKVTKTEKTCTFPVFNTCKRAIFNKVDYTNTPVQAQVLTPSNNDSVSYVQNQTGIATKVVLPDLRNILKDKEIAINKAELIVTTEDKTKTFSDKYKIVNYLGLMEISENDSVTPITDYVVGSNILPEKHKEESNGNYGSYTFNITRHIQRVVNGKVTNKNLVLKALPSDFMKRSIITRSNHSKAIKLKITYTDLSE